jgi:hypothetical protein
METYLRSLGQDFWFSVTPGYNALKKPKTAAQKEAKRNNILTIDTFLDGLKDSVKSKWDHVHHQKRFGTIYKNFLQGKKKKKKNKLKQITTYQISKKQIEVSSFSLIVKE